jgi:hypothetical protein
MIMMDAAAAAARMDAEAAESDASAGAAADRSSDEAASVSAEDVSGSGGGGGGSSASSAGSGSDTSAELARLLADGETRLEEGSETPPGLPPSMQPPMQPPTQAPISPLLPSPPPALGGGSFAEPPSTASRTGSSSAASRAEVLQARRQRAEVLSALQQQYSVVEENVARLELRCAAAEDDALKQREVAAAHLDAKVSAEAAAEELRGEVTSLHDALLRSEKALVSTKENATAEAQVASGRALQEIATQRSQLEGALAGYEAAQAAQSRAEAAAARAEASCSAAESTTQALADELTQLRVTQTASEGGHQNLLAELSRILSGGGGGTTSAAAGGALPKEEEDLLCQVQTALAGSSQRGDEVATCKALWEHESAALSEKWELASVAMLSRLSTMSQRVGRGERMQTRLTAAAEVLATTAAARAPEPEPEPEPRASPSPDRAPQLQAALDESTAAARVMEEKYLAASRELEETRRAFHKLHEKYSRTKLMLAHEKELRVRGEKGRGRGDEGVRGSRRKGEGHANASRRTTHIHYVVEGLPPEMDWGDDDIHHGDDGDGSKARSRTSRRRRNPSGEGRRRGSSAEGGRSAGGPEEDQAAEEEEEELGQEQDVEGDLAGNSSDGDSRSSSGSSGGGSRGGRDRRRQRQRQRRQPSPGSPSVGSAAEEDDGGVPLPEQYSRSSSDNGSRNPNPVRGYGGDIDSSVYEMHRQKYEVRELCRGDYGVPTLHGPAQVQVQQPQPHGQSHYRNGSRGRRTGSAAVAAAHVHVGGGGAAAY